jgi:hypothetical protein
MGATACSIIVADMQAMTARGSFVMTSAPLRQTSRSRHERGFQDNHVNCYFLDKPCHFAAGPARSARNISPDRHAIQVLRGHELLAHHSAIPCSPSGRGGAETAVRPARTGEERSMSVSRLLTIADHSYIPARIRSLKAAARSREWLLNNGTGRAPLRFQIWHLSEKFCAPRGLV